MTEDGMSMWHMVNATATTNYSFFSLSPRLPLVIGGVLEFGSVYFVSAPLYTLADIGAADFLRYNVIELEFQT